MTALPALPGNGQAGSRRASVLVFLFGLALYIGTLGYDFVWDDHVLIADNQYITQARYLPRFFTHDVAQLTAGGLQAPFYRPFFWTSLLLDFRAWGLRPAGFHLTNALLHALAGLLVFRLARAILGGDAPALGSALLFAAHPAHVEAIAFVAGRGEAMAAIGLLVAVLGYHRAGLADGWRRRAAALGSLAAFVFGLLSKEAAIGLPLILVWFEVTFPREASREGSGRMGGGLARLAPSVAVVVGFVAWRWGAVARWTSETLGAGSVWDRIPGALELLARYAVLAVLPARPQPWYELPRPASLLAFWPLAGLGLLLLMGGLALRYRRRCPVASFGLAWFLLGLGPVLDLVPVSYRAMAFATRYLFMPTIGLTLVAGAALARVLSVPGGPVWRGPAGGSARPRVRRVASAACALVILGWTVRTLTYVPVFRDNLRLFAQVAQDVPESALGHQNLGWALLRAGRAEEGRRALEQALAAEPGNALAQLALAKYHVASGRPAEGMRVLDHLAPWMGEQAAYFRTRAAAHLAQKEWRAAGEVLTRGLQRYPDSADLHLLRGEALEQMDDRPRAERAYRQALGLHPDIPGGRLALARLLVRDGRPGEAAAMLRGALQREPDSSAAWRILALALEAAGDAGGSRQAWERVLALEETPSARAEALRHLSPSGLPVRPSPTGTP